MFAPGRLVPAERRRIGMVFQDYALWPHMTVSENLEFALSAQRLPAAEARIRIAHALEVTRLAALRDRHPAALSGGQQQRVAIARCLAARPQLMLFDEPLSNLDAALREDLRSEMMEMVRSEGITVVYVTHDQVEAMAVSDRVAVMCAGEIAQFDRPEILYRFPATPFVASFIGGFSLLSGYGEEFGFRVAGEFLELDAPIGPAVLVVRPEDASHADLHPAARLSGRIRSAAFQGRCWRLAVEVANDVLKLDWPSYVPAGEAFQFSLPPACCRILPAHPEINSEEPHL